MGKPWRAWGSFGVLVLALATSSVFPGNLEDRIRYAGLLLQLLGVGTVAYLLRDKHRTFDRRGLWASTRAWFAERPRFRGGSVTLIVANAAHAHASGNAKISIWRSPTAGATLEQRLLAVEANVEALRVDLSESTAQANKTLQKLNSDVQAERTERQNADREVTAKLEQLGAGGLHVEAAGLFWLVVGIVFATVPVELASLWRLLW